MPPVVIASQIGTFFAERETDYILPETATLSALPGDGTYEYGFSALTFPLYSFGAIEGENVSLDIQGTILATTGVRAGTGNTLTISDTGSIASGDIGVFLESGNSFTNHGVISVEENVDLGFEDTWLPGRYKNFWGVHLWDNNDVQNTGVISGKNAGFWIEGDNNLVTNSGTIEQENGRFEFASSVVIRGYNNTIVNTGTIQGEAAIDILGDRTNIVNDGMILSTTTDPFTFHNTGVGIRFSQISVEHHAYTIAGLTVENNGYILGGDAAIWGGPGRDEIISTAFIEGNIYLGLGHDFYDLNGEADTIGRVYGMGGQDILLGGHFHDDLDGGSNHDILRGHGGTDWLRGRSGDDQIFGGTGNDKITGDEGSDRLWGDGGDDVLNAGDGDDVMRGGSGEDRLTGGSGRDVQIGGSNADHFIFHNTTDSATGSTRDAIRDFERGEDVIDLEDLVAGTLAYQGSSSFSGASAQVRHATTAAGSSVVQIDLDGDRVRDMEILVQFTPTLVESDFLL